MVTTAAASTTAKAAAGEAEDFATGTLRKLREQTDAVVERVRPQIDAVSGYARDEPAKAMLISAATGAALMGLVALIARSGGSRTDEARGTARSAMATIRDAALDLADRAHSAANDAMSATQNAASATQKFADAAQKRATDTADNVSSTVSDAWQSLRDQAAPVVDRLRPQIDAVTTYAKEDPARAALGLAAAGAVLVGLMALIRKSD